MNNKTRSIFRIGSISSIVLSVIAAIIYAIAYSSDYDTVLRHYKTGSVTAVVFAVFYAICIAVVSVSAILIRKRGTLEEGDPSQIEVFMLWLTAFMFFSFGVISFAFPTTTPTAITIGTLSAKLIAPLAVLSAVSFVLSISSKFRRSTIHAVTTFFPILWGVCLLFKYYFDLEDMPLNDPDLALTIVSVAALIVFFLSESRSALGINSPAISYFANCIAVCLGGTVSTVRIILSLVSSFTIPSLMENIIFFSVSVLAFIRLLVLDFKLPDESADPYGLYAAEVPDVTLAEEETDVTDSEGVGE